MTICAQLLSVLMLQTPLLISNGIKQALFLPLLDIFPTRNLLIHLRIPLLWTIPFVTPKKCLQPVCAVVTKATALLIAQQNVPVVQNVQSSWSGTKTASKRWMGSTSASCSTSEAPALQSPQIDTAPTPAPSVGTLVTGQEIAPVTDLSKVLYICTSPYFPPAWHRALLYAQLLPSFPFLVHDITYGSPIGNPPPLTCTFLPNNLPSANIRPDIIDQELLGETASGRMSGPFTIDQATIIFNGFFRCSPVGLVEKTPGDSNWRMIRHLSKQDATGCSTNDWIDSDDFPTTYFTASWVAQFVSATLVLYPNLWGCVTSIYDFIFYGMRPVFPWSPPFGFHHALVSPGVCSFVSCIALAPAIVSTVLWPVSVFCRPPMSSRVCCNLVCLMQSWQ